MAAEHDSKSDRIRLADCCLAGASILLAALMLCGLMTVVTHVILGDRTAAGRTLPVTEVATVRGQFQVPGRAYIDGRDAEGAVVQTEIEVWDSAAHEHVVCKLPHRASVFVSAARRLENEDSYYLRVRTGICEGWVSDRYLSPRLQPSAS